MKRWGAVVCVMVGCGCVTVRSRYDTDPLGAVATNGTVRCQSRHFYCGLMFKLWSNLDLFYRLQCAVMLEAPPYKQVDIPGPVKVSLKLFVPFKDEKEKNEFISKQLNEDNEDEFDENEDSVMTVATPATSSSSPAIVTASAATNQATASASAMTSLNASVASSLSPGSSNQTEMFREIPDGKYESRVLEFTYFAPGERLSLPHERLFRRLT